MLRSAFMAIVLLAAAVTAAMSPATAQEITTKAAIERLFTTPIQPAWFTEEFLAAVPAAEIDKLVSSLAETHGPYVATEGEGARLTVILADADVPTEIALDADGRIAGLFFAAPIATGGTVASHIAAIAALPGTTAVIVTTGGAVVSGHNADMPLAVGSTFKIAVLAALKDAVADGTVSADTVVHLDDAWKSAPSGVLQTWPVGTPLTIASLATEMISISDNTATDALIDILGRESVEAKSPRNTPLLKTAEIFKLNASAKAALLARWQDGDADERRALLAELAALPLPAASEIANAPAVAEWFITAREACDLIDAVAGEPAMSVNPGLAERGDWRAVAYKGGSNTGVLNFTTRVVAKDGEAHCVAATWNGTAPLDTGKLATPYRGILRALRDGRP